MDDKDPKTDVKAQGEPPATTNSSDAGKTADPNIDPFVGLVLEINGRPITLGPRTKSSLEQNGYVFHLDEEVPLGQLGNSDIVTWLGNLVEKLPFMTPLVEKLKDAEITLSELYIRMPPQDGVTKRKESFLAKFYGGWETPQTLIGTLKFKGAIFGGTNMSAEDLTKFLPHAMSAPLLAPPQPQKALPAAKGAEASQPGDRGGAKTPPA